MSKNTDDQNPEKKKQRYLTTDQIVDLNDWVRKNKSTLHNKTLQQIADEATAGLEFEYPISKAQVTKFVKRNKIKFVRRLAATGLDYANAKSFRKNRGRVVANILFNVCEKLKADLGVELLDPKDRFLLDCVRKNNDFTQEEMDEFLAKHDAKDNESDEEISQED